VSSKAEIYVQSRENKPVYVQSRSQLLLVDFRCLRLFVDLGRTRDGLSGALILDIRSTTSMTLHWRVTPRRLPPCQLTKARKMRMRTDLGKGRTSLATSSPAISSARAASFLIRLSALRAISICWSRDTSVSTCSTNCSWDSGGNSIFDSGGPNLLAPGGTANSLSTGRSGRESDILDRRNTPFLSSHLIRFKQRPYPIQALVSLVGACPVAMDIQHHGLR
jgi:hypothetical protein